MITIYLSTNSILHHLYLRVYLRLSLIVDWHTIGANNFVIDTIKFGYRIPFISTPCRALFHNSKSALENASFVQSAIFELVGNCSVVEVPCVPHVVNPLSVSIQSSGKKRLILDLRHVNQSIWKQKLKCKDWRVLLSYANECDFLFSFDLKDSLSTGIHGARLLLF